MRKFEENLAEASVEGASRSCGGGRGGGGGFSRGGCLNAIYGHGRLYEMGTEVYASLRYTGQCQARSR